MELPILRLDSLRVGRTPCVRHLRRGGPSGGNAERGCDYVDGVAPGPTKAGEVDGEPMLLDDGVT